MCIHYNCGESSTSSSHLPRYLSSNYRTHSLLLFMSTPVEGIAVYSTCPLTSQNYHPDNEVFFLRFGMLAPMLIQMERQIDREIAADQRRMDTSDGVQDVLHEDSDSEMEDEQPVLMYGPLPQIVTNDLKSLDEMVSKYLQFSCTRKFRGDGLSCFILRRGGQ